jgi:hypothetical protein
VIEDVLQVFADRAHRGEQCARDLSIAVALGHQLQHLPFPEGEPRQVMTSSLGIPVDLEEVWSQQLEHQLLPAGEIAAAMPEEQQIPLGSGRRRKSQTHEVFDAVEGEELGVERLSS